MRAEGTNEAELYVNHPNGKVEDILFLIEEGHFAEGSMLPKVQAACAFASSSKIGGKKTFICNFRRGEI